jgi:hypothetical protein
VSVAAAAPGNGAERAALKPLACVAGAALDAPPSTSPRSPLMSRASSGQRCADATAKAACPYSPPACREFVEDVHGVDLANDPPPDVRLISDTRF